LGRQVNEETWDAGVFFLGLRRWDVDWFEGTVLSTVWVWKEGLGAFAMFAGFGGVVLGNTRWKKH